jgi:histidinol phosphatase-like enzyme (inositol monophosphatase family)
MDANPDVDLPGLLEAARACALAAGDVTLAYFGGVLRADFKGDGTPVTEADRAAETLIRSMVSDRYPNHGVLGEEFGEDRPDAPIRWIVDPIDGTKSFMHGVPLYGVLIGVEVERRPVVGVAHFPALSETVSAATGLGCFWNDRPARVSDTRHVAEAVILTTTVKRSSDPPASKGLGTLLDSARIARTWGDCYGHALVATGRADAMIDPLLSYWDAGPLLTIMTEAGGRFTDVEGVATIHGGSGVSTNGQIHAEVLEALAAV